MIEPIWIISSFFFQTDLKSNRDVFVGGFSVNSVHYVVMGQLQAFQLIKKKLSASQVVESMDAINDTSVWIKGIYPFLIVFFPPENRLCHIV